MKGSYKCHPALIIDTSGPNWQESPMSRKLLIEYPGGIYRVLNRRD
jgi:hypothetical protein